MEVKNLLYKKYRRSKITGCCWYGA